VIILIIESGISGADYDINVPGLKRRKDEE